MPAERAAQLGLAEDDRMLLSRAALEYAHRPFIVSLPQVVHWLKLARERPSGNRSLEARVASRLGVELALAEPAQAEVANELLCEGELAARALGDPLTLGCVLNDVSAVSDPTTDPRGWLARAQEVVRWAQQGGDFELEFRGLAACATAHLQLGERAATEATLERCRQLVRARSHAYARGVTRCIEAMFALLDGRFEEARTAMDEVSAEASRGSAGLRALTVAQRFWLAIQEGLAGEMIPLLERRLAQRPGLAAPNAALALAHALEGQLGPALTALGAVVDGIPSLPRDLTRLPTLTYASEAAFRARAPIAAAALERELTPYGALSVVYQNAAACLGSVRQSLGWLAAARGRSDEAVRHFEAALGAHAALRSRPLCERSQRAIAEVRTKRRSRAV